MQQAKLASVTQWRDLGTYALRFKLHLIINDRGELLAFKLTPGNVDDRKPVPDMTQNLVGKLFGDRGYISQALFEQLYEQGLQLITRRQKNMKQQLVKLTDKILLRKSSLIETVVVQKKLKVLKAAHSRSSGASRRLEGIRPRVAKVCR